MDKPRRRICNLQYKRHLYPGRPVIFSGGTTGKFDPVTKMLPKDFFVRWRKLCRIERSECICTPLEFLSEILAQIPEDRTSSRKVLIGMLDELAQAQEVDLDELAQAIANLDTVMRGSDGLATLANRLSSPHLAACRWKNGQVQLRVLIPSSSSTATYTKMLAPGEPEPSRDDLIDEALAWHCSLDGTTVNIYENVPEAR